MLRNISLMIVSLSFFVVLVSCGGDYETIGYGVVFKDNIPAYSSPNPKGQSPAEKIEYGEVLEILIEKGKEIAPYIYTVRFRDKVYYVIQDDLYTNVTKLTGAEVGNPSVKRTYYAVGVGMIHLVNGAGIYLNMKVNVSNDQVTLTPSSYNQLSWGTVLYILFETNKLITPPQLYSNPNHDRKKYFLVMDISNPFFVGYINAVNIKPNVIPSVVSIEKATLLSAASMSAKEVGSLPLFELLSVKVDPYENYYQVISVPFSSSDVKPNTYILVDSVSTNIADVLFAFNLQKYKNDLTNMSSVSDQRRTEIVSFLKHFIDNNQSSDLYKFVLNIYNSLESSEYYLPEGEIE